MNNIFDQLKRDESLRLKPYKDTVSKLTIGYGRNLEDDGLTEEEAAGLLYNDIVRAKADLAAHLPVFLTLDDARRGVLINMTFNMGIHRVLEFQQTLALVRSGDFKGAAVDMLQSKWAEEVGPRAHRLAKQMESGQWQ